MQPEGKERAIVGIRRRNGCCAEARLSSCSDSFFRTLSHLNMILAFGNISPELSVRQLSKAFADILKLGDYERPAAVSEYAYAYERRELFLALQAIIFNFMKVNTTLHPSNIQSSDML